MSEWLQRHLPIWVLRPMFRAGMYIGKFFEKFKAKNMIKINIVGDLSLQDPARLAQVMEAAKDCDVLIQVGDMHPGYDVVKKYAALCVPGNHDIDWDKNSMGVKQWKHETPEVLIVGLNNSQDSFDQEAWDLIGAMLDPKITKTKFLVMHKALSNIVLPDGTESSHVMGEGSVNIDAQKMQALLLQIEGILAIHGHYHGWSLMRTAYADCLIEGRGGAAPTLGYSSILVTPSGWTIHSHDL